MWTKNFVDKKVRADGTALYETFDINLAKKKRETFQADKYVWDIGSEQSLYLKQLFALCEQLGIGRREDYYHLSYGFVYLCSLSVSFAKSKESKTFNDRGKKGNIFGA